MVKKKYQPVHPGQVLLEDFIIPQHLSQVELARKIKVPIQRINTLINGKRDMTPETAILLARFFKNTPEFWMNLQAQRDVAIAKEKMTRNKKSEAHV
ncbi:MAG: HigA family addiction module antidote protein [Candidatus Omnitrophica bacterium]|nr:HigA family addiction module antidote protein [Candidatus Omnitrophota bacterium]